MCILFRLITFEEKVQLAQARNLINHIFGGDIFGGARDTTKNQSNKINFVLKIHISSKFLDSALFQSRLLYSYFDLNCRISPLLLI